MPLLALVAATSIACLNPAHRDGQSIRCDINSPVMKLEGISAPPIAAACNDINCAKDPGVVARDHLADLTRGQALVCTVTVSKRGSNGRNPRTARCMVNGVDLSCAMVADGMAEKTGALICPQGQAGARKRQELLGGARDVLDLPVLWRYVPLFLIFMNIMAYIVFSLDHYRASRAMRRVAPSHLLGLTFAGGGLGALIAVTKYRHLEDETPFINQFAILIGLQVGALLAYIGLMLI